MYVEAAVMETHFGIRTVTGNIHCEGVSERERLASGIGERAKTKRKD